MMIPRTRALWCSLTAAGLLASLSCTSDEGENRSHPVLLSMTPNASYPYGGRFGIIVTGTGFDSGAVVTWNGQDRPTEFLSSNQLAATMTDQDNAKPDTVPVRVRNPDGARSGTLYFRLAPDAVTFSVDSFRPDNGKDLSPGDPVTVYFNSPLDPTSISDSAVTLSLAGSVVPSTATYLLAEHAIRVNATLQPLGAYQISASTLVRSTEGGGFAVPQSVVVYTTRAPFARLGFASGWVSLGMGTDGALRAAFTTGTNTTPYASFAQCQTACSTLNSWTVKGLDHSLTAGNILALSMAGNFPHMAWLDGTIRYSSGPNSSATVDSGFNVSWPDIAAAGGRVHLAFYANGLPMYGGCALGCINPANWSFSIAEGGTDTGWYNSIAVDSTGTVHLVYLSAPTADFHYARCTALCITPDWVSGIIDSAGAVGVTPSLAVASDGSLHVSYVDHTRSVLRYGTCSSSCDITGNWTLTDVANPASTGPKSSRLALGPNNQLNIAYYRSDTGALELATCSSGCTMSANWQILPITLSPSSFLQTVSLLVDSQGKRHIIWSNDGIKYLEF